MTKIESHYKENYKRLVKFYTLVFKNEQDAEDVVQEAYARALKYFPSFDASLVFEAWFSTIVRNAFLNHLHNKRGHQHEELDEFVLEGSLNYMDIGVLWEQIIDSIGKEKLEHQEVLMYHFEKGYSCTEISHFSDLTHRNIRKIVSDFRGKIRKELTA